MHSNVPLLINITLALVVAFLGGMLAKRVGLPTIVGYLLAGIAIGPFTPGFVGDVETIQQLAELGVIFLMFGVGLHFSFQDLLRVKNIAVPGALIQTALATAAGWALTRAWGWPPAAGIVLGLSISVASTVVLLRGLMDNGLLNTPHGQAAVGWLVMEDILSVLILVLMPVLNAGNGGYDWAALALTLAKAAAFVVIMFLAGARAIPWVLERVARTRSRELFILAVLAITLGVAMGAAELFGVSLALGAFVAGAIISQSHLSHQVGADVFAFREAFSVLFFVSVGMLVNPGFLWDNIGHVAALSGLVIIGKLLIVLVMGMFFPQPARTFMVIAVGLAQVGEFSFILGSGGVSLGLLEPNQYSLILAASLISITLNPFLYRLLPWLERTLRRVPGLWKHLDSDTPLPAVDESLLQNHVVIVGYGRIGSHMVQVLASLEVPILVIEEDMERIDDLNENHVNTLFGDAANSEVLTNAHLERARALIVTTPDPSAAAVVVASARALAPNLPIIARANTQEAMGDLAEMGANRIVHPELEGGLEMLYHTLLTLGYPLREVHEYAEAVRRDRYNVAVTTEDEHRSLHDLIHAADAIEVFWVKLSEESPLVGKTLADANIRARTGASVVAVVRGGKLVANPKSSSVFEVSDRLGLIGEAEQVAAAREWLSAAPAPAPEAVPVADHTGNVPDVPTAASTLKSAAPDDPNAPPPPA